MSEPTIKVDLTVPDGLPEIKALLSCKPKNQAELDAVVEACGGPCAFVYHSDYGSHAKLPDGTTLMVEAYDKPPSTRMPPSVAKLQAACPR